MKNLYILIFLCFIYQCKDTKDESFNLCKDLDLTTARIGEIPFVTNYSDLKMLLGDPFIEIDSCSSSSILYKQGFHYYDCIEFKNTPGIRFNLYKDTVFISSIDFSLVENSIAIGDFKISKNSTINDFRNSCLPTELQLNKGASMARVNGQNWLFLKESTDQRPKGRKNVMEVWFDENMVSKIFYDWQPSYTKTEFKKYLEIKEKITQ